MTDKTGGIAYDGLIRACQVPQVPVDQAAADLDFGDVDEILYGQRSAARR